MDALSMSFQLADESKQLVKVLVIAERVDGSFLTLDSDLTANEAKILCSAFVSWIDQALGRELERGKSGHGS